MSEPRSYRGVSAADRVADRRAAIVSACLDIALADGVAAVTAEAVCQRAGLTKRYFYESFRDRDAALAAILGQFLQDLQARIVDDVAGVERSRRPALVVGHIVGSLVADPRIARVFAQASAVDALRRVRDAGVDRYIALLVAEVMPWAGKASPAARETVVRMVVAGTTDTIAAWLAGELNVDRETLENSIVEAGLAISERF